MNSFVSLREAEASIEQTTSAFDPRTEVSADAQFLWKRIFIWFWAVPVIITLLVLMFESWK